MSYRVIFILILLSSSPLCAQQTKEFNLSNGLKLIVKPDHRAPIAVLQIWYKVGSVDEPPGQSGISHLLEHLMYKGTEDDPEGHLFKSMNQIGAQGNAFTGRDYSYFFHKLEKSHLPLAFQLEASRMQYLFFDPYQLELEKRVVLEEYATRRSNDPYINAYDQLYSLTFGKYGYGAPITGYKTDLRGLSLRQVKNWYRLYYQPANAVLVVSGDIEPGQAYHLTKRYFGKIPKTSLPGKVESEHVTASQQKQQRLKIANPLPVGMLLVAFKVPVIKTAQPQWEAYALEALAGWLDGGSNSYLTRKVVKNRQLASQIKVIYSPLSRYDNLFIFEFLPAKGVTLATLEDALNQEISNLKKRLISPNELQKVKNQIISTAIYEQDSQHIQAKIIGQAEAIGLKWQDDAQYVERIKAVKAPQLQQVLNKYFTADRKTTVIQPTENNY